MEGPSLFWLVMVPSIIIMVIWAIPKIGVPMQLILTIGLYLPLNTIEMSMGRWVILWMCIGMPSAVIGGFWGTDCDTPFKCVATLFWLAFIILGILILVYEPTI